MTVGLHYRWTAEYEHNHVQMVISAGYDKSILYCFGIGIFIYIGGTWIFAISEESPKRSKLIRPSGIHTNPFIVPTMT